MKKLTTLAICLMIFQTIFAQAPGTVTTVEGVFGGRINAITGGKVGSTILSDTFRIFVATESANSIFYTYGHFPTFGTSTVDSFIALPSANATAGLGSSISKMAFHKKSQTLYFIANGNIYATTVAAASATKLTTSNNYADLIVEGNSFYSLTTSGSDNSVFYSSINVSTGALTAVSNTTVSSQSYTSLVDGKDDKLYLFRSSTDPQALQFGGTFSAGINFAATTIDTMATLVNTITWNCMGVYTDGTVFIGGTNGGTNPYKYVANTATFNTAYTTIATGIAGSSGSNIEFRDGLLSNYYVYFGSAYSNSKGAISTWSNFGNSSHETHPNDGAVKFFNNNITNNGTLLLTTDAGLGITKNSGSVISDINNGILATQVEDFDMNSSKTFGWLAAKDGIRYVNNYNTAAKSWTTAFWPTGDGSPYYSAEMIGNDTNSVYVGNLRIYKTTDKGTTWNRMFTPEDAPYSFPSVGVRAEAIAVSDSLNNIIMAGYYSQNAGQYGGVFYSMDGGISWNQLLINATVSGQDVNVNDIEMTTDSGKVVAYIGVEYINSTVRGMYKAQYDGTSWTVRREEISANPTALFSVKDIAIHSKDTILAVGEFYNSGLGQKYGMHFSISRPTRNIWNNAINTTHNGGYTACAWNNDTLFYAYQDSILYDKLTFDATGGHLVGIALYSTVDRGTKINVMYYDELLVGSSTGFRSMRGASEIYSEPGNPVITIATNKTAICVNQSIIFTATTDNAGSNPTYTWKVNGVPIGGNNPTFTTNVLPNNASVTCTVAADGKTQTSNTITITVYGNPFIAAIAGSNSTCMLGSSTNLTNTTVGGIWSSSNTSVATISLNGIVKSVANGFTTITYTLTDANGCKNSMTKIFNVAPQAVPQIAGANNVCVGSNIALTNMTPNTTSAWSSIAGRANVSNTGVVTGTSVGTATIKLIATNNFGCSNSNTYNVVVNGSPAMPTIAYAAGTVSPQTSAGFCKNRTFTLVGSPTGGVWSSSNATAMTITSGGVVNTVGLGTASISYTIASNKGCNSVRIATGTVVNCASKATTTNASVNQSIQFSLYPNPAKSFVNITVDKLVGNGNIIILDLLGKQVKQQVLSLGKNTIDVSRFVKGIYLVSIEMNGERTTQKLIIE